MNVSREQLALLTEIGFAAAAAGLSKEALVIFEGVKAVRPGSEAPAVGMAMAHIGQGAYREAVECLRSEALPKSDGRSDVLFMLAVALKLDGLGAEFDHALGELKARAAAGDAVAVSGVQALSTAFAAT